MIVRHLSIAGSLLFTLVLAFLLSPAVSAAESGVIDGRIVGKNGATGIGGTTVVLEIASASGGTPDERKTIAGDDGAFRFEGVPIVSGDVYLLKATYDGGTYFQEVTFANGATQVTATPIAVYPSTRDASVVTFPRLNMILSTVDQSGAQVIETGAYRNGADRAYIGPQGARDATSLRFGLPEGASNVQLAQGLNRDTLVSLDATYNGFATLEAIPPGEQQFALLYRLIPNGRALDLDRVFPHQTNLFTLYLPPSARVASVPGGVALQDGGETTLQNGQKFHVYTAANIPAGGHLAARISNLPIGSEGVNPLLPALAVFVLLFGIGLIAVYRRRRTPSPVTMAARRQLRTVPGGRQVTGVPSGNGLDDGMGDGEDLAARKERLLLELVDLDDAYESGRLPEAEYRQRRAARKDELLATLRALEAPVRAEG